MQQGSPHNLSPITSVVRNAGQIWALCLGHLLNGDHGWVDASSLPPSVSKSIKGDVKGLGDGMRQLPSSTYIARQHAAGTVSGKSRCSALATRLRGLLTLLPFQRSAEHPALSAIIRTERALTQRVTPISGHQLTKRELASLT